MKKIILWFLKILRNFRLFLELVTLGIMLITVFQILKLIDLIFKTRFLEKIIEKIDNISEKQTLLDFLISKLGK